ncbi:hypothetical protein B0H16DRAFT_1731722 [Mycena metata]|uniref:Uncharacterized protein n=1 Tax=Mycena metata TaxID=1033252 RepID=A0AAD7I430_9AGAR|nr:hypothetical protein B0H16DRAFT_1731722 [Mycena metata]
MRCGRLSMQKTFTASSFASPRRSRTNTSFDVLRVLPPTPRHPHAPSTSPPLPERHHHPHLQASCGFNLRPKSSPEAPASTPSLVAKTIRHDNAIAQISMRALTSEDHDPRSLLQDAQTRDLLLPGERSTGNALTRRSGAAPALSPHDCACSDPVDDALSSHTVIGGDAIILPIVSILLAVSLDSSKTRIRRQYEGIRKTKPRLMIVPAVLLVVREQPAK